MKNELKKVLVSSIGVAIIVVSGIVLYSYENQKISGYNSDNKIKGSLKEVKSDYIDESNNDKLIMTKGEITFPKGNVVDSQFGVTAKTMKISRVVEMYQWNEKKSTDESENQTANYNKIWSSQLINSRNFTDPGYNNPTFLYESYDIVMTNVKVGEYTISPELLQTIVADKRLELNGINIGGDFKIVDNFITNSVDLSSPKIGDIRISYYINESNNVTAVGKQSSQTITKYINSEKKDSIGAIYDGNKSKSQVISNLNINTKIDNILGYLFAAVAMIFGGFLVAKNQENKKMINVIIKGFALGIFALSVVLSWLWFSFNTTTFLICLVIAIIAYITSIYMTIRD